MSKSYNRLQINTITLFLLNLIKITYQLESYCGTARITILR